MFKTPIYSSLPSCQFSSKTLTSDIELRNLCGILEICAAKSVNELRIDWARSRFRPRSLVSERNLSGFITDLTFSLFWTNSEIASKPYS